MYIAWHMADAGTMGGPVDRGLPRLREDSVGAAQQNLDANGEGSEVA